MTILKKQQGMATILLVLLIGLTLMIVTATVARSLVSNKESSVAAHGQTNAQLMGWAGVSAFRVYLLKQGSLGLNNLDKLKNTSVMLKNDPNSKTITAKNIKVYGCTTEIDKCTITAEISSNNITSQAATTIQAVYEFTVKNGQISVAGESASVNYSGNTYLLGSNVEAELPNTKVTIQVEGDIHIGSSLTTGFKTKNISELTVNATGDVRINCVYSNCSNTKINVNAQGLVDLTNGGNYGSIHAGKNVNLTSNVTADSIYSIGNVTLSNASTNSIHANGDVLLSFGAFGGNIYSNAKVTLSLSKATNISAHGKVNLGGFTAVSQDVQSAQDVTLFSSTVDGDIRAYDYVDLNGSLLGRSQVHGSVFAKGNKLSTSLLGILGLSYSYAVTLSYSTVDQNVYAKGRVGSVFFSSIGGTTLSTLPIALKESEKKILDEKLNFTVPKVVDTKHISSQISSQLNFKTHVDVRVYKDEANYIFTQKNKIARVYLNKLKSQRTGITYIYRNGDQYMLEGETEKYVNDKGFYLGKYTHNGKVYVGAICEEVDKVYRTIESGTCTSPIIGYLPRVSVEALFDGGKYFDLFGYPKDYLHTFNILGEILDSVGELLTEILNPSKDYKDFTNGHTWYLSSKSGQSDIDNAAFAPGIFYFEGNLSIIGYKSANLFKESNSTFTNSFLTEGNILAMSSSPKVYSPYNVSRAGGAANICNRTLNTTSGQSVGSTTPVSLDSKYLIPTNLCKSQNEFKFDMNRDSFGNKTKVTIDNHVIDKLDLGYVALMSNQMIIYGGCTQIFGDVLARSAIRSIELCTNGSSTITGNISTQGVPPYSETIQHSNYFDAGSKTIVPQQEYSNIKNTIGTETESGLVVDTGSLQWAKYL